ncbi:MAG: hypothetical protein VB144_03130 [Clostridia bacterium]|nr:hypothetical protein [Clostridia bacterium]
MPANFTPQYMEAGEAFKRATATEDKIAALEEMLRAIPKHKGADSLASS